MYPLKNYSPIPDRKPVPSQLEAHRLESVDAWDVDYWDDTPGCIDDPVLGAYRDRSFTTSYSARFRINESGTVFGDLDVARQLIDDMVVSRCVRNTPYNFTLAAFVPEGDVPVWVNCRTWNSSRTIQRRCSSSYGKNHCPEKVVRNTRPSMCCSSVRILRVSLPIYATGSISTASTCGKHSMTNGRAHRGPSQLKDHGRRTSDTC